MYLLIYCIYVLVLHPALFKRLRVPFMICARFFGRFPSTKCLSIVSNNIHIVRPFCVLQVDVIYILLRQVTSMNIHLHLPKCVLKAAN